MDCCFSHDLTLSSSNVNKMLQVYNYTVDKYYLFWEIIKYIQDLKKKIIYILKYIYWEIMEWGLISWQQN